MRCSTPVKRNAEREPRQRSRHPSEPIDADHTRLQAQRNCVRNRLGDRRRAIRCRLKRARIGAGPVRHACDNDPPIRRPRMLDKDTLPLLRGAIASMERAAVSEATDVVRSRRRSRAAEASAGATKTRPSRIANRSERAP